MGYNQDIALLKITDFSCIAEHKDSLFQYVDNKYLVYGSNQNHCYYWTNGITYFNKHLISMAEEGHANIKRTLKSTLGDLPEVMRLVKKKMKDQSCKICF